MPRTDIGSLSSPRTSRFPNSIFNQQLQGLASHSATAFNNTFTSPHRQPFTPLFWLTIRLENSKSLPPLSPRTALLHSRQHTFAAGSHSTQFSCERKPLSRGISLGRTPHRSAKLLHQLFQLCSATEQHNPAQHGNGPCRNRTYNLAIKSRLLCQLS